MSLLLVAGSWGCSALPSSGGARQDWPVSAKEIGRTVHALHRIWGPDQEVQYSAPVLCDLNADGHPEVLLLMYRQGSWEQKEAMAAGLADLRKGVYAEGFMVLEAVEGRAWPVFYCWVYWRLSLQLKELDGHLGIVSEGGKDGRQAFWGWVPHGEFPPPYWAARERFWEREANRYGPWRQHSLGSSAQQGK